MGLGWYALMEHQAGANSHLDSWVALIAADDVRSAWLDAVVRHVELGKMSLGEGRYAVLRIYCYSPELVTDAHLKAVGLEDGVHAID